METKSARLSDNDIKEATHEPDPSTKDFIMQQTMMRIKDPKKSLDFYTRILGMRLLKAFHLPSMSFSVYFLGYEDPKDFPEGDDAMIMWLFSRRATIELTHNYGTENDPAQHYHNGNSDPRGFGHIGISVPDIDEACARFEQLNVPFQKKLNTGMKGLAFIRDPDNYWIEILSTKLRI